MENAAVVAFGRSLKPEDEVILEVAGNTSAIIRLLTPFVKRFVIANSLQVKAIANAHAKTDKSNARNPMHVSLILQLPSAAPV